MKELMIGNAAVARGLYEAGCRYVSSYPGTPSTEITEFAAGYDEVYAEWASNEKVALESAVGASLAGARSFTAVSYTHLDVYKRQARGWTLEEAAGKAGCSAEFLRDVERGLRRPMLELFCNLGDALGLSADAALAAARDQRG